MSRQMPLTQYGKPTDTDSRLARNLGVLLSYPVTYFAAEEQPVISISASAVDGHSKLEANQTCYSA
jgi:hypothetical protein